MEEVAVGLIGFLLDLKATLVFSGSFSSKSWIKSDSVFDFVGFGGVGGFGIDLAME